MNVEIINVGTELLLGEIINTNATYLQKMCKELGLIEDLIVSLLQED